MIRFYASSITILFLTLKGFSVGLDVKNYSLAKEVNVPLLMVSSYDSDPSESSETIGSNSTTSDLAPVLSTGRALGTIGTICWVTGKIFEVAGLIKAFETGESGLLITGIFLDLLGPIPSCIGESVVMRNVSSSNVSIKDPASLRVKGWSYYGYNYMFLAIGIISNTLGSSAGILPLAVVGSIAGITAEVLRGISAIAPLVRVNRVAMQISMQPLPVNDRKNAVGLALSFSF